MAHRGEAPARTSFDAAASARRSEEAEVASLRLLLELEQRHRSVLQALVAQQASIPASLVSPVVNPAVMRSPRPGNGAAFGAFSSATRSSPPPRPTAPAVFSPTPTSHELHHSRRLRGVPLAERVRAGFGVRRARARRPARRARELDVDARGRTLVGVESGPHKELRVALDRMRSAPRYGALGMADELILLTADAVAFRDDAGGQGAGRRARASSSSTRATIAPSPRTLSWVVDGASPRTSSPTSWTKPPRRGARPRRRGRRSSPGSGPESARRGTPRRREDATERP